MAQRYDENRDLLQIQVGELENQIRELAGAMQHRDQRIVELEALAGKWERQQQCSKIIQWRVPCVHCKHRRLYGYFNHLTVTQ